MRLLFLILSLIYTGIIGYTNELLHEEELVLSTPEEIGSHTGTLIRGIVSPLSGNPSMKCTDLVVKGAQEIRLERIYAPLYIPHPLHNKKKHQKSWDKRSLYDLFPIGYRNWKFFPQRYLNYYPKSQLIRTTDRNGLTLDFKVSQENTTLVSSSCGMKNCSGDTPAGKSDPRNTQIVLENDGRTIVVQSPDGTHRIYSITHGSKTTCYYQLQKEILPNGKILNYRFNNGRLAYIESLSPDESIVYASLRLEEDLNYKECKFISSSYDTVSYLYEQRPINVEIKHARPQSINTFFPPILINVSSPFYRSEILKYSDKFQLNHFEGKSDLFECDYGIFGKRGSQHYKLAKLSLPIGPESSFQEVCSIHYDPPIAKTHEGITTVQNENGTKTIYRFNNDFLSQSIETYDEHGALKLQKRYAWMDNGWLKSIELVDGEENLFSKKSYEYDRFGNPTVETILGDLSGSGSRETYTIKREYSQDGRNLLLYEENEEGKITLFEYLPNTNLITAKFIKDKDQILTREFYVYDAWNNLTQKISDDGKSENILDLTGVTQRTWTDIHLRQEAPFVHMPEWVEEKYLESGEEKLAKRKNLTYDRWGNVGQEDIYDNKGEFFYTIYRTYDEQGNLLTETNALGQKRTFSYDEKGRLIQSVNYSGRLQINKAYDRKGRLVHEEHITIEGNKKIFAFSYDSNDALIETIDEHENSTHYEYDLISHKPTSCEFPKIQSVDGEALSVISHLGYDALGREITKTDANGNTTHFKYNARGNITEIVYPNGSQEIFRYYKNGKLKKHIDQEGLITLYEYDLLGHLILKKYQHDKPIAQETFTYNALHLLSESDKEGNVTSNSYDGLGRKSKENRSGRTIEYQFDSLGRLNSTIYHNGENTLIHSLERDLLGRVILEKKTNALGISLYKIAYAYDEDGNKKEITRFINNKQNTETFSYDAFGRIIEQKDALGNVTQTTYDDQYYNSIGQKVLQTTVINPKGVQTIKTYDAHDSVTHKQIKNPKGEPLSAKEFIFDPYGNLLFEKDLIYKNTQSQKNQTTSFSYNSTNLLEKFTRGFGTTNTRTTQYTYTPSGKISSKTLPNGSSLYYDYDPLGFGKGLRSSEGIIYHSFKRDLLGNLLEASDHDLHLTRLIDPFGNILHEEISTGLYIEKSYDAFNRPLSSKIADHGEINYDYDPLCLRNVSRISDGTVKYTHAYQKYDLDGNLLEERGIGNCGPIFHQINQKGRKTAITSSYLKQTMTYDVSDNLTSIEENGKDLTFVYDDLNQLIEENQPDSSFSYAYDSNYNRLQKNQEIAQINALDELQSLGSTTCEYDLNGNIIKKKTSNNTMHFVYDALNQLIEAKDDDQSIYFSYDPLGRRISKTVQKLGSNKISKELYLWDGQQEIGAFDENNHCKNLKVIGIQDPIAIELAEQTFIPILDIQRNIRLLINSIDPSQEFSYNFTSFGKETSSNPILLNPWAYAGKRWDPELALSYFGKRYYDPELGRWLTSDPLGFVDGTNLYQYLFNNPYRFTDSNGEFVIAIPLIVWGAGAAAPTLAAIGTYIAAGVATGAVAYGGYKLYESYQHDPVTETSYNLANSSQASKTETKEEKRHTADQEAISEFIKEYGKKGVSNEDANTLLDWAKEYNFPHRDDRGKDHWEARGGQNHIHLGPKHIPVNN